MLITAVFPLGSCVNTETDVGGPLASATHIPYIISQSSSQTFWPWTLRGKKKQTSMNVWNRCFACRTWEKVGCFWIYNVCHCKNDTLGMFLPKCVIMAAAEVINSRLMCVRCYLSSSSREREPGYEWAASIMRAPRPASLGSCFSSGTCASPLGLSFVIRNTALHTHSNTDNLIRVTVGMPVALCQ